ncbi:hypothetical protein, partial [Clostridium sporogenes]|uniref:hypothetical protein n=1 Tax=Clostridium sporogenes TaxID=1509 RepID=UPI0013D86FD5
QSHNLDSAAQIEKSINIKENIKPSSGISTTQREQIINTKENIQPSSGSKTIHKEQNVDIVENVKSNGLNNDNKQSVIVKEH